MSERKEIVHFNSESIAVEGMASSPKVENVVLMIALEICLRFLNKTFYLSRIDNVYCYPIRLF